MLRMERLPWLCADAARQRRAGSAPRPETGLFARVAHGLRHMRHKKSKKQAKHRMAEFPGNGGDRLEVSRDGIRQCDTLTVDQAKRSGRIFRYYAEYKGKVLKK
jgi:hypothetical protein